MTGLYTPDSGEILVNSERVLEDRFDFFRQHFSAIFSDFHLFEQLLGVGKTGLDKKASEHLEKLDIDHKVQVKNGILFTTDLSAGQRKRLALVVAYLENRPVYLFDEWAADQDPEFKKVFYYELLPELKAE